MSFQATIEQIGNLDIVNIGIEGFDYSSVTDNAGVTEICASSIGKKLNMLDLLTDNDYDFSVPFDHFYGVDGQPVFRGHDRIRTFGPQELVGGRKIVAGIVQIDFLGTNPKKSPMVGIQKILNDLDNPLQNRWDSDEHEEELDDQTYSWEEIACIVEELPSGLSVLRFNFFGENISRLHEEEIVKNVNNFTNFTLAQLGMV